MGKHGPCYHCGVTSTPLWRNGPPEKPVLCNACGSRWRTKGTLVNYTPLHARAEPEDLDDYRVKSFSVKNKEEKFLKRKYNNNNNNNNNNNISITEYPAEYNQNQNHHGFRKVFDEDTSNRSSSGSAISISNSEQYGNADASELTGPSQQGVVWERMVPSRKRTCVSRSKPSSVEKLTRDLFTILHEQQSSCLSGCSEEEQLLLLESDKPMESVEFGHGSVLIRHPSSILLANGEEESEASSLSFDNNKQHTMNSKVTVFPALIDKIKKPPNPVTEQERIRRGKDQVENLQIMSHRNSPLCCVDLQEIVNFDKFANHLTKDEQQQLLKYLPPLDTLESSDRNLLPISQIRSILESPEFKENLLSFQKLLSDGLFDNSFSSLNTEQDCKLLKKLVLSNFTKSKWIEQYQIFKDSKGKNINEPNALATASSLSLKRPRGEGLQQHHKFLGSKAIMRRSYDEEEEELVADKSSSFFTSSRIINNNDDDYESCHFGYEEDDMLLDIPSNGSFPQAEAELLIMPSSSFDGQASTSTTSTYFLNRP
ncbi:hypothetical protein ABFS82_05G078200 [Erythranthe guttata]|uniref:Uncharacterized protein n=1 Tax=Erythranthe guttata TaxID=4155 RepID=A0A022PUF2_ERYGU|nr:PREDICTED: GATA transcription factor 27-like isoform X2 [Erythranthe guttata]EYU17880.1 hypothetical protein MIMGU_mgv1a004195mg [Erythranthe guttata]|eukprot:XP_012829122.1 PREDICTED: GATA transcription factor 27-like isoform X2 [Erythranthe guttata]